MKKLFFNSTSLETKINRKHIVLLFVFAVIIYAWQIFTIYGAGGDSGYQLGSALNFLDGYGFSILKAEEIGEVYEEKLIAWPLVYRLIAVPVLLITLFDVEITTLLMFVLSFAFLIFSIAFFVYVSSFKYKKLCIAIIFLFSAITFSPFKYMFSSDMLALGMTLMALGFFVRHFRCPGNLINLFMFFLFVALLPQTRYAYIPMSLAFLFFYFIASYFNRNSFKPIHLGFLLLPVLSLWQTFTNPYFLSQTSRRIGDTESVQVITENVIWWLKPYYASFFNAFFPDYIIISFLQRFPDVYENVAVFVLAIFAILSLAIFAAVIFCFLKNIKSFSGFFKQQKLSETGLMIIILANLAFYVLISKDVNRTEDDIFFYMFTYGRLAVHNRYHVAIHMGVILLSIQYLIHYRPVVFKYLIILSLLFGSMHFIYMRSVYHPFDREANLNFRHTPEGSYKDVRNIGNFITHEKKNHETYFINDISRTEDNYRQPRPLNFAVSNAAIILNADADLSKAALIDDISVLISTDAGVEPEIDAEWKIVYNGEVYDLYKLIE